MTETEWTAVMQEQMIACGALVFPLVAGMRQVSGLPDRLIVSRHWSGLVEFKGLKTRVKANQAWNIRQINRRKLGFALVVRYPNRIESEDGTLLCEFDGTGRGLLMQLEVACVNMDKEKYS